LTSMICRELSQPCLFSATANDQGGAAPLRLPRNWIAERLGMKK
jgi:hypothetical protein